MMALSRFTPWFAVSALMPFGSSSTHSFHLDFKNINVLLRLPYLFFIYPSFEVHASIYSTNNACLFAAAPSIQCSVRDIRKIKCNLCIIFEYRGYLQQRARSETARHSL